LATAGFDRKILLWDVYNNCNNIGILGECKNAVLEVNWSTDGTRLFTASADKTAVVWDMETYTSLKKLKGHSSYVNTCNAPRRGTDTLATGGDDGLTKIWDLRTKKF
jgi:Prp8 binding protein